MANCATCNAEMPDERLELGLKHCSNCTNQTKPRGAMEYDHKTAGVLVVTDDAGFHELKKPAEKRRYEESEEETENEDYD